MGKTNKLAAGKCSQVTILCEQGLTVTAIAAHFSTLKWYHECGYFKSKAKNG